MPHRLLVPCHVTTHPPPLAPLRLAKEIENMPPNKAETHNEVVCTPHAASLAPIPSREPPATEFKTPQCCMSVSVDTGTAVVRFLGQFIPVHKLEHPGFLQNPIETHTPGHGHGFHTIV